MRCDDRRLCRVCVLLRVLLRRIDLSWCNAVVTADCKRVLQRLLDRDPATRMTVVELLVRVDSCCPIVR
jgi:hypothetical protein